MSELNLVKANQTLANIELNKSFVLEIYIDEYKKDNFVGGTIVDISECKAVNEVVYKIEEAAANFDLENYPDYVIWGGGNSVNNYASKIIRVIYYNATFTERPVEPTPGPRKLPTPNYVPIKDYEGKVEIINEGAAPTELQLFIKCNTASDKIVAFTLNDVNYLIDLTTIDYPIIDLVINSSGVYADEQPIDTFDFPNVPVLQLGENILALKKSNVTDLTVKYTNKY